MKNRRVVISACAFLISIGIIQSPSLAVAAQEQANAASQCEHDNANLPSATRELLIHATRDKVWKAIQARRTSTILRKLVSYQGNQAVVKETFEGVPVVGAISCTYQETESIPNQRIDYHMVESSRFKAFQGNYQLRLAPDGVSTILQLTSAIDPGIRIPFWQEIAHAQASKSVKETLEEIARLAGDTPQK
jgi:hypothetical protein